MFRQFDKLGSQRKVSVSALIIWGKKPDLTFKTPTYENRDASFFPARQGGDNKDIRAEGPYPLFILLENTSLEVEASKRGELATGLPRILPLKRPKVLQGLRTWGLIPYISFLTGFIVLTVKILGGWITINSKAWFKNLVKDISSILLYLRSLSGVLKRVNRIDSNMYCKPILPSL